MIIDYSLKRWAWYEKGVSASEEGEFLTNEVSSRILSPN